MGFIVPGGVAKKKFGWQIPDEAAPVVDALAQFDYRGIAASMDYFAEYAALFPGVVGAGGTFDPTSASPDSWFTLGNSRFNVGGSGSSAAGNAVLSASLVAFEFLVVSRRDSNVIFNMGAYETAYPYSYDTIPEPPPPAFGATAADYAVNSGDVYGGNVLFTDMIPMVVGDVFGVVFSPGANTVSFFLNGQHRATVLLTTTEARPYAQAYSGA